MCSVDDKRGSLRTLSGVRPKLGHRVRQPDIAIGKRAESFAPAPASSLLWLAAMSTADRPTTVPAQPATTLDHQCRAALGAARRCSDDCAARASDEHLALAATVPV